MTDSMLSGGDRDALRRLIGQVVDNHAGGTLSREGSISTLELVIHAVDRRDGAELRRWLDEGQGAPTVLACSHVR